MKNQVRILFALVLCLFICQTNVEGQIFKKALSKVKGAVGSVVGSKTGGAVEIPKGPAKPAAPEVKNAVSDVRSYTGLTKEAFLAKIKAQGYVAGQAANGMALSGDVYKNSAGYYLAVSYGTRSGSLFVRDISKAKDTKNPVLPTVKKTFLDYGKQCIAVKAEFTDGSLLGVAGSKAKVKAKNSADWTSKFLPAFDSFVSAKEMGMADQNYHEACYNYFISYSYTLGVAIVTVRVIDLTLESQEG